MFSPCDKNNMKLNLCLQISFTKFGIMVLFNLTKFILLIQAIHSCPPGVPNRGHKIFEEYNRFESVSDDMISVSVIASLERFSKEMSVDEEDADRKKKIIVQIINQYSSSSFEFPQDFSKIHLISHLDYCNICKDGQLVVVRPSTPGKDVTVYRKNGGVGGQLYHKQCQNLSCLATVYDSYSEYKNGGQMMRKYHKLSEMKYFAITQDSFFDVEFLEELSEDIFTCYVRISNFVKKYNRLNPKIPLNKKRIFHSWLIYIIMKRLPDVEFPVFRSRDRNIDIDKTCQYLYPKLRRVIDERWVKHQCSKCSSRTIIMDGAAKAYRLSVFSSTSLNILFPQLTVRVSLVVASLEEANVPLIFIKIVF